jgi:beta-lactamase class A
MGGAAAGVPGCRHYISTDLYLDKSLFSGKIIRYMCLFRAFLFGLLTLAASTPSFADGQDGFPTLWESHDPGLQRQLDKALTELGLDAAIKSKQLSVTLVDITDPEEPREASVNGDEMLYAASLPKIAILLHWTRIPVPH